MSQTTSKEQLAIERAAEVREWFVQNPKIRLIVLVRDEVCDVCQKRVRRGSEAWHKRSSAGESVTLCGTCEVLPRIVGNLEDFAW